MDKERTHTPEMTSTEKANTEQGSLNAGVDTGLNIDGATTMAGVEDASLGRGMQTGVLETTRKILPAVTQTWTLIKRELRAYFDGPAAYVVLSVFLAIIGWFFGNALFLQNVASLRPVFNLAPFIFLFFVPALTMAAFAEERRSGTLELLLTFPIRDWQVIAGKLIAVSMLLLIAIGLTGVYAFTVAVLGDLDFGATAGGYLGLFLLGGTYASIGIWASSLTRNQVVAFILGFAIIFALYLVDKVTDFLPGSLGFVLQYLGTDYHFQNLLRGVIDTRDLLYYASVIAFSFLMTLYTLGRRPE